MLFEFGIIFSLFKRTLDLFIYHLILLARLMSSFVKPEADFKKSFFLEK